MSLCCAVVTASGRTNQGAERGERRRTEARRCEVKAPFGSGSLSSYIPPSALSRPGFKSESETWWNTIWLPSKLLTPHQTSPPASTRNLFCLYIYICIYALYIFNICPRKPIQSTAALWWRFEKAALMAKALPEQAMVPDSPAPEAIRLLLLWVLERVGGVSKVKTDGTGSSGMCPFTPIIIIIIDGAFEEIISDGAERWGRTRRLGSPMQLSVCSLCQQ